MICPHCGRHQHDPTTDGAWGDLGTCRCPPEYAIPRPAYDCPDHGTKLYPCCNHARSVSPDPLSPLTEAELSDLDAFDGSGSRPRWPWRTIRALVTEIRSLRGIVGTLRDLEWMGTPEHGEPTCPACCEIKRVGHRYDCPISRVLDPLPRPRRCAKCGKPEQHVNHYDGGHLFVGRT